MGSGYRQAAALLSDIRKRLGTALLRPLCLVLLVLLLAPGIARTADFDWVPRFDGRVNDLAKVLSASQRDRLEGILARYEQETTHQIAILIVPTLSGESIESFSLRVGNSWKIGHKGLDDGILVVLAVADGQARIQLGLGMEKFITNELAKSIIVTSMIPAFKQGQFAEGLERGLLPLMEAGRKFVVYSSARRRYLEQ